MSTRASLTDLATVKAHGYSVESWGALYGWTLTHESDPKGYLMIGDHGCISPTRWEAVAEALARIEQDERLSAPINDTLAASANAIARTERVAGLS